MGNHYFLVGLRKLRHASPNFFACTYRYVHHFLRRPGGNGGKVRVTAGIAGVSKGEGENTGSGMNGDDEIGTMGEIGGIGEVVKLDEGGGGGILLNRRGGAAGICLCC